MRGWLLGALTAAAAAVGGGWGAPPEQKVQAPRHVTITPARPQPGPASRGFLRGRGRVVRDTMWAQSLGVRKQLVLWLPPSYDQSPRRRYPLAIYLHGIWGDETNWTQLGAIHEALDSLVAAGMPEFIVAMPDGDDGWYTTWNTLGDYFGCRRDFRPREGDTVDSYCVPWLHYDDYIARDVVQFVDRGYRTERRRERRAIGGLSMGGYGALSIAFAYPEVFRVAVSHSGVLSPMYTGPRPFAPPATYASSAAELEQAWGERFWPLIGPAFGPDTSAWWSRDPARRAATLWHTRRALMPDLLFDIGTDDELLQQNRAFRWELQRLGIPHLYAEWPGKHEWPYWKQHVYESLRFVADRIAR
ncbi:MAG: alpha/beta hydrolase [Gemmatimonadaceae bacterium]